LAIIVVVVVNVVVVVFVVVRERYEAYAGQEHSMLINNKIKINHESN